MSKNISCAFLICLFSIATYAQPVSFSKTIDYYQGMDFPVSVIELDSGYTVMGYGQNFQLTGGWFGCVIVKTDLFGDTVLSNFYGKRTVNHSAGWFGSFIKVSTYGYALGVSEFDSSRSHAEAALIRYD